MGELLERNPVYRSARSRPAFSLSDPAGFTASEYERQHQREAARALEVQLQEAVGRGDKELVVPPGEYRFSDNAGWLIRGLTDFTIRAKGACLWFERDDDQLGADPKGLRFVDCRNVSWIGATIDFDPPVYLQARIVEIDEAAEILVVESDPAWPYADVPAGQFSAYKPDGSLVGQHVDRHEGATRIGERKLRVSLPRGLLQSHNGDPRLIEYTRGRVTIREGDYLALIFRRGSAVSLQRCGGMRLEDVDIYASPGMAILENGGPGGSSYRRVRVIRKPGTRRLHVSCADTFHSRNMAVGPSIVECEFSYSSDDMVNLHGYFGFVFHVASPTELVIGTDNDLRPGGRLDFYDFRTVELQGSALIQSVVPLPDGKLRTAALRRLDTEGPHVHASRQLSRVTLDRPVEAAWSTLVDTHLDFQRGFLVKDCYFHDSRGRGMLLSGASDGRVEGCVFQRVSSGPEIYMESWLYMEGPIPRNVTLERNLILECGGLRPAGHIGAGLVPGGGPGIRETRPLSGIRFLNNVLVRPGGVALRFLYVDGGEIRGNTIIEPLDWTGRHGLADESREVYGVRHYPRTQFSAISVWASRDVRIEGNAIYDPRGYCRDGAIQVGDFTEGITVEGNLLEMGPEG